MTDKAILANVRTVRRAIGRRMARAEIAADRWVDSHRIVSVAMVALTLATLAAVNVAIR